MDEHKHRLRVLSKNEMHGISYVRRDGMYVPVMYIGNTGDTSAFEPWVAFRCRSCGSDFYITRRHLRVRTTNSWFAKQPLVVAAYGRVRRWNMYVDSHSIVI